MSNCCFLISGVGLQGSPVQCEEGQFLHAARPWVNCKLRADILGFDSFIAATIPQLSPGLLPSSSAL